MGLTYILGSAGSGKTTYLDEQIISDAEKHLDWNYYVIVPEQFTMKTQKEYVANSKNHCIMNIDVVSFDRLAYRIFDELGLSSYTVLQDVGKNLVLRHIIEVHKGELKILNKNIEKPGYIDQIKSLISELEQYQVLPKELEEVIESLDEGVLRYKLEDICILYQSFLDNLSDKYITAEEILGLLADHVQESKLLNQAVFAFDGYTGFTPIQNRLVEELLKASREAYITVLMDPREDYTAVALEHELFYSGKKFIRQMNQLALRAKCLLNEPHICGNTYRYQKAEDLKHLEANLFRRQVTKYKGEPLNIKIIAYGSPKEELETVCHKIYQLVDQQGYRYRDFGIISGDVATYGEYAKSIFEMVQIPLYVDEKKQLAYGAGTECVKAALEVIEENYSYDGVFRLLKTGMTDFTFEEVDELENVALKMRIRGRKSWTSNWDNHLMDEEELSRANWLREKFLVQIEDLLELSKHNKKQNPRIYCEGIYRFMERIRLAEKLNVESKHLEEVGEEIRAKAYEKSYSIIIELLDKTVDLLGDNLLNLTEFREILEAGFDATKVGTIPVGSDYVTLGDVERTRLEHVKVLYFIGMNEGIIPHITSGSECLSRNERRILSTHDVELAPSQTERLFMEQLYLYMVCTKPSNGLELSYVEYNQEGKVMQPSSFLDQVKKLYYQLNVERPDKQIDLDDLITPDQALEVLGQYINHYEEVPAEVIGGLWRWCEDNEDYRSKAEHILDGANYSYEGFAINQEMAQALYGEVLQNSVTRLESFESCPMAHFLHYGLQLEERNIGEFNAMDMGSVMHETLEIYGNRLQLEGQGWDEIGDDKRADYIGNALEQALEKLNTLSLYENARTSYEVVRMKQIAETTAWQVGEQVKGSACKPAYFEQNFDQIDEEGVTYYKLTDDLQMKLRGKIDRIDIHHELGRVNYEIIDYKSGGKTVDLGEVYSGLQLQLVVYLQVAKALLQKKFPDCEIVENGMNYYHLQNPLVSSEAFQEDARTNEELYKVLASKPVKALEEDKAYGYKVTETYAQYKIREIAERMMKGEITAHPYKMNDKSGCDYCPYQAVCGFDDKIEGYEYRNLKKMKGEDALHEMEVYVNKRKLSADDLKKGDQ